MEVREQTPSCAEGVKSSKVKHRPLQICKIRKSALSTSVEVCSSSLFLSFRPIILYFASVVLPPGSINLSGLAGR